MAIAREEVTTQIVLTLSEDEASLLYRALGMIMIKDSSFEDEDEYDAAAALLSGIHTSLADARVTEMDDVEFEIA